MKYWNKILICLMVFLGCFSDVFSQTGNYHKVLTSGQELTAQSTIKTVDNSYYIIGKIGQQSGFLMKTGFLYVSLNTFKSTS